MTYDVCILSNQTGTVVCIGITRDLVRRVYEHKSKLDPGSFTAKYDVHKLVCFEETSDVYSALEREKQLKSWNRKRKINWLRAKILAGKTCIQSYCANTVFK